MTEPTDLIEQCLRGLVIQLSRMMEGARYVQDGYVRVLDAPYLVDTLRLAADSLASVTAERDEARRERDQANEWAGSMVGAIDEPKALRQTTDEMEKRALVAEAELTRLREALSALVDKLDECKPYVDGAFTFQQLHGGRYTGPNYGDELLAARAAIRSRDAIAKPETP